MFERIKRLYELHQLTTDGLANAVKKGWITEEQFQYLNGMTYSEYMKAKDYEQANPAEEETEDAT